MKVHFEQVPSSTLDTLRQILVQGGPGRGAMLFRPSLRWQTIMGGIAAALGLLGIYLAASMASDPHSQPWGPIISGGLAAIFLLYATAALRDHLLRNREGLGAFVLVTPINVVRCWGAHMPLEFHRLKEATEFKTVQEYDEKQNHKGRRFRFAFGKQVVDFLVSDPQLVNDLDEVTELAKAKGRGEALPDFPGARIPDLLPFGPETQEGVLMRVFMNPRSEFWLLMGGLLCIALLIALFIAIVASRRH